MDIPNLSQNPAPVTFQKKEKVINPVFLVIVIILAIGSGYFLSNNSSKSSGGIANNLTGSNNVEINVDRAEDVKVGKVYGNPKDSYKDSATGTIEKGSINGEGTHILKRAGGDDQRASLTSSAIDLDLFVGKKVEVKGETNASKKTGWLLDVGTIKVLE